MVRELISRHIWSSLRTADVFPVVASLPTTGNTSAVRRLHLVPSEYSSFDHFPKSNLPNENIKVTQRQNFWISSDRRFTVTCPKGFSGSLPLDETEYCQQTIRSKKAIASVIYEGNNNNKKYSQNGWAIGKYSKNPRIRTQ